MPGHRDGCDRRHITVLGLPGAAVMAAQPVRSHHTVVMAIICGEPATRGTRPTVCAPGMGAFSDTSNCGITSEITSIVASGSDASDQFPSRGAWVAERSFRS